MATKTQCYHFLVSQAGYVLVGGRSSRMGRDKALLPYRGITLGRYVAGAVAAAAGNATLIGDPERYSVFGYPVIPDLYPGEGPLGGILTALAHSSSDWNLITACDMPALGPEFLGQLLDAARKRRSDILVPLTPGERLEPLCAVYCGDARGVLQAAFERGVRKISEAFKGLRVAPYPVAEVAIFQNVNTPEEWAEYAAG